MRPQSLAKITTCRVPSRLLPFPPPNPLTCPSLGTPSKPAAADGEEDSTSVRVALRVRPLVAKERMEKARECVRVDGTRSVVVGMDRRFTFDYVYGPESRQVREQACIHATPCWR